MDMQNIKQVWKEVQAEETRPAASLPTYPAPQIKINHDKAVWLLQNEEAPAELGPQVSVFVVRVHAQTTVFNPDGRLVLKSGLYAPKEKSKALVLYGRFTGMLLTEALQSLDEDVSVVNSWVMPVVITSTQPQTAVWEAKRSALKSLINFMREEGISSLTGHELTMKLVKQKNGMKVWAEPKVVRFKPVDDISDDVLKLAYTYMTEFEQFRIKYNFRPQSTADDTPDMEL